MKLLGTIEILEKKARSKKPVEWKSFEKNEEIIGYFNDLIITIKPFLFECEEGLLCEVKRNTTSDMLYYKKFYEHKDINIVKKTMEKFVKAFYKVT